MQEAFGKFNAPLHSTGEGFNPVARAVEQSDAGQNLFNPLLQFRSAETIEVSLMPKVLVGGQFQIDALCLEDDADMTPERARLANCIQTDDGSGARTRHHKSRKNPEKSRLTTAVWAE